MKSFPIKSFPIKSFRVFVLAACLAASTLGVLQVARAQVSPAAFDEMKRSAKAAHVNAASELRANVDALDGKTIELSGEVTGLLSRDGNKIVLLKIGEDMVVLGVAPEASTHDIHAGTAMRLLVRVNAASKDNTFSIVAATETGAPVVATVDASNQTGDGAAIYATTGATAETAETLPQPPAAISSPKAITPFSTTIPAPKRQPNPSQPKSLSSRGGTSRVLTPAQIRKPAPAANPNSFDVEESIEEQKPAYESIIRAHNKRLKPEVVEQIAEALLRAGAKYNMDPRFLAAIIAVESDFDVNCLSGSGAMGLGQLMPFNLPECGVKNPWNPTENVFGTACLLRGHLNEFGNRPNGTLLAVAAYNAGPGAVRRAGYKVPNGAQVQHYVWKVYYRYKSFAPDMF